MMSAPDRSRTAVIIGGGLVGSLNACFFAKRGWKVLIFEQREDPRDSPEEYNGRSISLSASERARAALRAVGLEEVVVDLCTKQYGRNCRPVGWKQFYMAYGAKQEHILSISRRRLNEVLLTEAQKLPNVSIKFGHKLLSYSIASNELRILRLEDQTALNLSEFDLLCACDGAFSRLRRSFLSFPNFDFSQQWISDCYLELCVPKRNGKFAMNPASVQLWSRDEFCIVGLANVDGCFALNLFAPRKLFANFKSEKQILDFFHRNCPDILELAGEKHVVETLSNYKPAPMISVKCKPYHFGDKVVLLGDSAHAMAPFYAQGMNCGFEDCLVLNEKLDEHSENLGAALRAYSEQRCPDCHAINDLAMHNYLELRKLSCSRSIRFRKRVDAFLEWLLPRKWIPLYSMVTFTRLRYSEIVTQRKAQDRVLGWIFRIFLIVPACFLLTLWFCQK